MAEVITMSKPKISPPARQRKNPRYTGVPHMTRRGYIAQAMRLSATTYEDPNGPEALRDAQATVRILTYLQASAMPGTRDARTPNEARDRLTKAEIKRTRKQMRGVSL